MPSDGGAGLTGLLRAWSRGDRDAFDQLTPLVYDEIRRIAAARMRGERAGHTLSPTDLVSEAFLRLAGEEQPEYADRVHFFAIAARHMRQILVEHARRRDADKRGGGERPLSLGEGIAAISPSEDLLALDEAIHALSEVDERKAKTVELFYFGGMTHDEIGAALGVHVNTVARDLRMAEAWLGRRLEEGK